MIQPFAIEIDAPFKTKYSNEPEGVTVVIGAYTHLPWQPGIHIMCKSGEPLMRATMNLIDYADNPETHLEPGETWIKDYSENEGVLAALIEHKIIEYTQVDVTIGFGTHSVTYHRAKLIGRALELWEAAREADN